jgi:hypothetical protein
MAGLFKKWLALIWLQRYKSNHFLRVSTLIDPSCHQDLACLKKLNVI